MVFFLFHFFSSYIALKREHTGTT